MKKIFHSIQFMMTLSISVVSLVAMILLTVIFYDRFTETVSGSLTVNASQTVDLTENVINIYINNMIEVSEVILEGLHDQYISGEKSIEDVIVNTLKMRKDIASLIILDQEGSFVFHAPADLTVKDEVDVANQEWYDPEEAVRKKYYFSPPHVQNVFENSYPWVVTLCRDIRILSGDESRYFQLMIDMNFLSIDDYVKQVTVGKQGYMFILDENNEIIYHPQMQMIHSGIKSENLAFLQGKEDGLYDDDDDKNLYIVKSIEHTNWKLVGVSHRGDYESVLNEWLYFVGLVFLVIFFFVLLLSVFVAGKTLNPIVNLAKVMEDADSENLSLYTIESNLDEVKRLSNSYNKMVVRIKELMEKIKKEEQELRKSELKALQAQINPHFLYNTLDSILWMCEQNETQKAVAMVSALSTLFRISISKGAEIISIKEELVHAESYLTIQKLRYKDQFTYAFEVDEHLLSCRCLKIILQPLLENAIYHGIDRMVSEGRITVRVRDRGNRILMQVEDNGLGMPYEVQEGILSRTQETKYGIGVRNVHNRIMIYFGQEYGLSIESEPDEGTVVNVWIPKLEEEK